jgi:hypothetical protein
MPEVLISYDKMTIRQFKYWKGIYKEMGCELTCSADQQAVVCCEADSLETIH